MVNVSEITGAFTIPYGIHLSNAIWEVLNQTGIVYIPFLFVIMKAFKDARAMGQDEGSSQVMALKLMEQGFISKFFVLMVFVVPISVGHDNVPETYSGSSFQTINYKAYSCAVNRSSVLGANASNDIVLPRLPSMFEYNLDMPIALGLTNQFVNAFTQTMNGQIPCDEKTSARLGEGDTAIIDLSENPKLLYSAKQFYGQCYVRASENLNNAIDANLYNDGVSLTTKQNRFNTEHYFNAYMGYIPNPETKTPHNTYTNFEKLTISVNTDSWIVPVDTRATDSDSSTASFQCDQAMDHVYSALYEHIEDNKGDAITELANQLKMYPEKDGTVHVSQGSAVTEVTDRLVTQALIDGAANTIAVFNTSNNKVLLRDNNALEEIVAIASTVGTGVTNLVSNHAYGLLTPVLVSVLISIIYISSPVLIVISGYNYTVCTMIVYTIGFMIGLMFIFEVGLYVESVVIAQAFSSLGALEGASVSDLSQLLKTTIIPTMVGIWSIMGALLGVLVIPIFSQMLQQFSNNIGQSALMLASAALNLITARLGSAVKAGIKAGKSLGNKG